jgi:hypothetical protein
MLVLLLSLPCMWWSDVFITKLHINLFRSRQIQKLLVWTIHIEGLESTIWGEVCAMFSISKVQKTSKNAS